MDCGLCLILRGVPGAGAGGGAGRRGWSFIFLSVVEVLGMRPETLELKSVQGRVRL